ncbi:D-hexose-6-phosphate mutarotase [Agarivorans gilvus]|jgi:glucose-6-phosphate 1-epimerase|uniref:Putative glucose-6-phosphate 1-epimerase n=1 Tax=Agarivorans gilvus TaxID=680279 RepID=A0ABQ1HX61_9ALTE|nr:D-hexose-6-phosphate mutarotase [Agarivorans gilvus]GGA92734.1 D-hexose-6-phosphate mutarotase [Agarivorans gilvus]
MILEKLQLTVVKQLDNAVFEAQNQQGMVFYWIDHPKVKALIAQQGAHLISYRPNNGQELLWLSENSEFSPSKAIRGGVPVCWPRFANAGTSPFPKHGIARTAIWQLNTLSTSANECSLSLGLTHPSTPNIELECRFTLSQQAKIELITHNHSKQPFSYTGALHSYFITDVKKLHIRSLGPQYFDAVTAQLQQLDEDFQLSPETDRIYLQAEDTSIMSYANQQVEIHHQGHDSVVVWNPGSALAAQMPDLSSADDFICIETAITQQAQSVAAGESHRLCQTIKA